MPRERKVSRAYAEELRTNRKSNLVAIAALMLGTHKALAEACGVSSPRISQMVKLFDTPQGIPAAMAYRIEVATKGRLKAWMFRSDVVPVPRFRRTKAEMAALSKRSKVDEPSEPEPVLEAA